MSLRSLRHLFEPERILWVGPEGEPPRWARIAEANLWDAGFEGPIQALRSTGRAPAEARIETLAGLPRRAAPRRGLPAAGRPAGPAATSWPPAAAAPSPCSAAGPAPAALDGGQARAARAAARSARAAADRPRPGRRDRARAAAQHGLGHRDAAARATSPSSPSRIRSPPPCSNGRRPQGSASRASPPWASSPRSSWATSWTIWPWTSRPGPS